MLRGIPSRTVRLLVDPFTNNYHRRYGFYVDAGMMSRSGARRLVDPRTMDFFLAPNGYHIDGMTYNGSYSDIVDPATGEYTGEYY